jgi:hypothetical protein
MNHQCQRRNRAAPGAVPLRRAVFFACARIISVKILLKSLIVWLLLLAVPFQGFASATMLMCAPMQSIAHGAAVAATPAPPHDHAAMLAAQSAGQEHHATGSSAAAAHADAGDASAAGHHASGKCNSCAACCFGAAMAPSHIGGIFAEAQNFPVLAFDAGAVPAVDLALPERPPKSSLT